MHFAAAPRLVAGLALGAAAAAIPLLFVDTPGRILLVVLIAALSGESLRLAVIRPALSIGATGVRVRHAGRDSIYAWADVGRVSATTTRRLVTTKLLELDVGDTLVVIPSYRLGADPADVVAAIEAARPVDG
jgi:hypothetical protein